MPIKHFYYKSGQSILRVVAKKKPTIHTRPANGLFHIEQYAPYDQWIDMRPVDLDTIQQFNYIGWLYA